MLKDRHSDLLLNTAIDFTILFIFIVFATLCTMLWLSLGVSRKEDNCKLEC